VWVLPNQVAWCLLTLDRSDYLRDDGETTLVNIAFTANKR
jgi:hypothetical protein